MFDLYLIEIRSALERNQRNHSTLHKYIQVFINYLPSTYVLKQANLVRHIHPFATRNFRFFSGKDLISIFIFIKRTYMCRCTGNLQKRHLIFLFMYSKQKYVQNKDFTYHDFGKLGICTFFRFTENLRKNNNVAFIIRYSMYLFFSQISISISLKYIFSLY